MRARLMIFMARINRILVTLVLFLIFAKTFRSLSPLTTFIHMFICIIYYFPFNYLNLIFRCHVSAYYPVICNIESFYYEGTSNCGGNFPLILKLRKSVSKILKILSKS